MDIKDFELNFARIQFYKPLASKLHPAGAFSLVETAFLRSLTNKLSWLGTLFQLELCGTCAEHVSQIIYEICLDY